MDLNKFLCRLRFNRTGVRKMFPLLAVCLGLFFCAPAYSQTLGRISGIVTDSSGGAIAGATVTVTDVARGIPRNITTDSSGAYVAPNLIPGTYGVRATFMGFQAFDRLGIEIGVGADVHVDITLQPGAQTQTITVTEEAPAITTTNAQLEGTIAANALSDLPFSGHNYVQLIGLLPTFQLKPGSGAGRTQDNSNGLPGEFNVFVLDGVADQMSYNSTSAVNGGYPAGGPEQAVMLPTDAIQEFNVVQNGKAEFGWRPGAQLNVAIKSGTNSIHGTAFALGRDASTMARNAFFNIKTPTQFENYGGSFGGAARKDKLFYLLGYEGQRYTVGNPRTSTVPSTASGLGASSSLPDAINDLLNHNVQPSPLSLNLAGCSITPAVACTANKGLFGNATQSTSLPVDFLTTGGTDNGVGRLDYHLNEHHNMAAYFFDGDGIAVAPVSNVNQPYWSSPMEVHTKVVRAWETWVPNSAWVNDVRIGWDWTNSSNVGYYDCEPQSGAPNYASLGFISGAPVCGFPSVMITGFSGSVLGGAGTLNESGAISRLLDNVSYTHGNHIFKFGAEFLHAALNFQSYINGGKGTFTFNTNTAVLNAFTGATALDNFMAGDVSSATVQTGSVPRNFTNFSYAFFGQDDWRILPRLTVNLGLRYEYTLPIHEVDNLIGNVDLNSPSGICQVGVSGCPFYKMNRLDFAPRLGLAWDITGKGTTVLRAGFNIMYEQPWVEHFISTQTMLQLVPTGLPLKNGNTVVTTPGGIDTLTSLNISPPASPIPWTLNTPIFGNYVGTTGSCTNAVPCSAPGVVQHLEYPEVINWNLGIQRAITNRITLDVAYVGNRGQHLNGARDLNEPAPGASGTATEQTRRPYSGKFPWFSSMPVFGTFSNVSNYHALQVIVRGRASHGLTFLATYTYAHALSSVNPTQVSNPNSEYGNAPSDIRHRFTFGPSYLIPGKAGFGQMLQGWQIASTASVYSGRAFNATDMADDLSGTGQGTADPDRWTLVGDPHDFHGFGAPGGIPCFVSPTASGAFAAKVNGRNVCTVGLPQACVNAANSEPNGPTGIANNTGIAELNRLGCYMMGSSVIVAPAQGTFGDMSPYELYGAGFWEWDTSIIKSWHIKERLTTQFRAEFYNLTNTTQYATPSNTLSAPSTFGQATATPDVSANSTIVGTGGPRKIQLGLKFLF